MSKVRVGIAGAGGRMGRKLIEVVLDDPFNPPFIMELTAAVEQANHPLLGTQATMLCGNTKSKNEVKLTDSFNPDDVDVFIDFSTPAAAVELSRQCRKHKIALIVGVTGFSKAEEKELHSAASDIALLVSPNMSTSVLSMFELVRQAATTLWGHDVEICEAHHHHKKDSPSGTALRLGKIIAEARGDDFDNVAVFNRKRQGNVRGKNEIGFSVIRAGDIVGEHRVIFAGVGAQLEIINRSTDRINYASGAVWAAGYLFGKRGTPKLYSMQDVADEFAKK